MNMMEFLNKPILEQIYEEEDKKVFDLLMKLATTTEAATQTGQVGERHDEAG